MVDLSIIYVYYNNSDVIFNSIDSVIKTVKNISFEIIISVNRCDDITVESLKQYSNKIKIIDNGENLGFAKANNIALKKVNSEFVLFLNPDIVLKEKSINELLKEIKKDKEIGLLSPKLIDENGRLQKTVIYKKYSPLYLILEYFFIFNIPLIKKLFYSFYYSENDYNTIQHPVAISGAFMLFRYNIIKELNGFDEDFFMYAEDKNLSLRAKKITQIKYIPQIEVIHLGGATFGKAPSVSKLKLMVSAQLLNIKKLFGTLSYFYVTIFFIINGILFLLVSFIPKIPRKNLFRNRSLAILSVAFRKYEKIISSFHSS